MRRHTTKEPSGPATSARARPASRALSRKSAMLAAISVNMRFYRAFDAQARRCLGNYRAMQIVLMVMVVGVDGQALGVLAEQLDKGRIEADLFRMAGTADVTVEADHLISGAHHQVQVVGHHQHAAAMTVTQLGDQAVHLGLAGHIDALYRLIQHQQFWLAQQGTCQQHALQFAAGDALQRAVDYLFRAHFGQRILHIRAADARHQAQKAQHRERQGGIDMQLLRHIADAQFGLAPDAAAVRLEQTEYGAHQGGFASAVGADQGDDFTRFYAELYILQHILPGEGHAHSGEADQGIAHAGSWQPAQRPTTSTVWLSTAKPTPAALLIMALLIVACSNSMAALQLRQIRNWPWWACSGWLQPTKALSEAMRCTRPFSSRKSKARYTVGCAARRPSSSLNTPRMS